MVYTGRMKRNSSIVISYMQLRALIGFLGILLPFLCFFWDCAFNGGSVPDSISLHYYLNFRDIFVGILVTVSFFLITYRGYTLLDDVTTWAIGLSGLATALFPCENPGWTEKVSVFMLDNAVTNAVHLSAAGTFFTLLAFNSLFLFTRSKTAVVKGSRKYWRNIVYRICGAVILVPLVAMALVTVFTSAEFRQHTKIILILETIMLVSFGVSWLVKGGAIMGDRNERAEARRKARRAARREAP